MYIKRALIRFLHTLKAYTHHSFYAFIPPTYGLKHQHQDTISHIPLNSTNKEWKELIVDVLLCYARAIGSTM